LLVLENGRKIMVVVLITVTTCHCLQFTYDKPQQKTINYTHCILLLADFRQSSFATDAASD